jgi:uncharacterized DUF497 family protein
MSRRSGIGGFRGKNYPNRVLSAQIVPQKLIEYSFGDRDGAVEFVPGANGVTVRVMFDAESQNPVERHGRRAMLDGRVVVIAHAPRGSDVTRIISMRKANRREQKTYHQKRLGPA